jgi:hypothetical protein
MLTNADDITDGLLTKTVPTTGLSCAIASGGQPETTHAIAAKKNVRATAAIIVPPAICSANSKQAAS